MADAAGRHGCNVRGGPDPEWATRSRRTYRMNDWMTACRVDFGEDGPEWGGLLARLRRWRAFTLRDPSALEPEGVGVIDGMSVQVEVLEGDGYRTYGYGAPRVQPWPEAVHADSILRLVSRLEP